MKACWTEFDTRDQVIDFINRFHDLTKISVIRLIGWLGLSPGKYYDWRNRYGVANDHNGKIPRDYWLEAWEKQAIIDYFILHPTEGYRRLTYMMIDENIIACAPSTVYRVLKEADLLNNRKLKPSKKGTGFIQPEKKHEHWHIDVTYLNLSGTFYYMCSVLDGFSRYIVSWDIREAMKEKNIEMIIQKGMEQFPGAKPRIISDNGPQFISKDFKEFIRFAGMTHVRTSPYYPQSNGKQERMQGTVKQECIRERNPATVGEAKRFVEEYIQHYNQSRLHSAIGYISPLDKLEGRATAIHEERDRKLIEARENRRNNSQECVA